MGMHCVHVRLFLKAAAPPTPVDAVAVLAVVVVVRVGRYVVYTEEQAAELSAEERLQVRVCGGEGGGGGTASCIGSGREAGRGK